MYQVLYRKYRPKFFRDVVGQDHVTITLQNEISSHRLGHAYLFIGSHGTGKTTCAKILAKAVNCQNPQNGNPCGICEFCKKIDVGNATDIVELDAASNNGVNDIREICESAVFTPAQTKYRVYIIDEVHMLSTGAFNALLKTLEEPPDHVIFVLATTEAHKVPATILSRCQRFEFHKISANEIVNRIKFLSDKENFEIDDNAALLIANNSDGALRDSLVILDKCLSLEKHITVDVVSSVIGLIPQKVLFELVEALINNSVEDALAIINNFDSYAKDVMCIIKELIEYFRKLLIIKTYKKAKELVIVSDDDYTQLLKLSEQTSKANIIFIMDILQETYKNMFHSCDIRTDFEICVVKLCSPDLIYDAKSILVRLEKLEQKVNILANSKIVVESNKTEENVVLSEKPEIEENLVKPLIPNKASDIDINNLQKNAKKMSNWSIILDTLKEYSPIIATAFKDTQAYVSGNFVLIDSNSEIAFELLRKSNQRDKIRKAIKEVTGKSYKLGPYTVKNNVSVDDKLVKFVESAKKSGISVNEI